MNTQLPEELIAQDEAKWRNATIVQPASSSVSNRRMFTLCKQYIDQNGLPDGLVAEFGVYSGTGIIALQDIFQTVVYGFDSWRGLPQTDVDRYTENFQPKQFSLNGTRPELNNEKIVLVDGWFKDSLSKFFEEHKEPFRLMAIDCDLYSSTKDIFTFAKNNIVKGTLIFFDEYRLYQGWQEREYKAFLEFIIDSKLDYEYLYKSNNEERAVVVIK